MEILLFVAGLALGAGVVFVFLKKLINQKEDGLLSQLTEVNNRKAEDENSLQKEREKVLVLERSLAKTESDNENLVRRFEQESKVQETRFENLANKILEDKSKKFTDQNKANLSDLLNPLKERINSFEQKVEKSNKDSLAWNATLKEQISALKESNLQITKEAENLTKALKGDSKIQGDWGELQLELLLEKAGLEKEIHFTTQSAIRDDEGNLKRPDFIINLPEDKHLIIDSKVSLTAYERYVGEEDEEKGAAYIKQHLVSIREKIKDLSEKNYQDLYGLNAPDYVMMFIPVEPAFHVAVQHDDSLYNYALDKNIILVTTSTLLAVMRTVAYIWRQDKQTKHVLEIARVGGTLYDKFEGFTQDLIKVGKSLEATKTSYQDAMGKLTEGKGNLVSQTERLKELGAKAKKSISQKLLDRAGSDEA
ncbi:MAG: DNA recombination protein RmuC [Cyclobacteriaceae bacterium]|nr:DNA recombination protein RmuC [Cyclobacteriaceae bacterium]